jgi:tetratricopeptide (TPR) repeat protein
MPRDHGRGRSFPIRASEAIATALLLGSLFWPEAARAQDRERANLLFRRGSLLFSRGAYQPALSLLERAQRLYPSHKIEVSIGYTLEQLGRLPEAAASFERYLADPESRTNPRLVSEVEGKLRQLQRSLARLSLSHRARGGVVMVDGKELARTPLPHPLYLAPGAHQVELQRGGRTLFRQTLSLQAGEHRLAIVKDPARRARPRAAGPAATPIYKRWWLWTAVGGALLTAVLVGAIAPSTGGSDRLPTGSLGTIDLMK